MFAGKNKILPVFIPEEEEVEVEGEDPEAQLVDSTSLYTQETGDSDR